MASEGEGGRACSGSSLGWMAGCAAVAAIHRSVYRVRVLPQTARALGFRVALSSSLARVRAATREAVADASFTGTGRAAERFAAPERATEAFPRWP